MMVIRAEKWVDEREVIQVKDRRLIYKRPKIFPSPKKDEKNWE